jgi:hypothetical protein
VKLGDRVTFWPAAVESDIGVVLRCILRGSSAFEHSFESCFAVCATILGIRGVLRSFKSIDGCLVYSTPGHDR